MLAQEKDSYRLISEFPRPALSPPDAPAVAARSRLASMGRRGLRRGQQKFRGRQQPLIAANTVRVTSWGAGAPCPSRFQ